MSFQAVVLAAGKGTRMRSETIKVLHEVLGRTLLDRVVDTAFRAGAARVTVVLGHDREKVEAHLLARADADKLANKISALFSADTQRAVVDGQEGRQCYRLCFFL
ncbi:MAG: NTP transferase domain-containing protein [Myxococcota bacterium]|nr:NTP transferase domain-containing protein [Myxococcota bacterium]